MKKLHNKPCEGTPFRIETLSIENGEGQWDSTKISIFRDDALIGEYLRNYPQYGSLTFYPFEIEGQWYALYSASYTTTRVMKLHEDRIEDWCGEEESSIGFCPVEMYVPRYILTKHTYTHDGVIREFDSVSVDSEPEDYAESLQSLDKPGTISNYCDFGFLCGCVWGDDNEWKIRYIDLKKIPEKVLSITDKFGYWQMPQKLTLKECVDMSLWQPDHHWITLTRAESINLKTDERC